MVNNMWKHIVVPPCYGIKVGETFIYVQAHDTTIVRRVTVDTIIYKQQGMCHHPAPAAPVDRYGSSYHPDYVVFGDCYKLCPYHENIVQSIPVHSRRYYLESPNVETPRILQDPM